MKNDILKLFRRGLLLIFLIVTITSSAQSYSWAANKKFSLSCYGYRTSLSPIDNSVCVSGNFIGPYSEPDSNDMGGFVMKYDASGSLQWQKVFYSAAAALCTINATDSQGNVFVSGYFSGNMQFDNNMFTGGGMFLLKYAPDGTLLFSYHEPRARANTICIDQNNNIYLAGTFNTDLDTIFHGQPFHKDLFIAKYDQYGNFLWVKGFFCFEYTEKAFDMCLDTLGNIYTTGIFGVENPYFTDAIQLMSTGDYDGYVAKYNSNAELQWVKTIKGAGMEVSKSISVSITGDIFIGGYYDNYIGSSATFFDSISILKGGSGNNAADVFIAKYDASGNCQWVRTAGGNGNDFVKGVYVDNSGNAFITGHFGSYGDSAVFGNQTLYCPHGQIAVFLAQYDTNGNLKSVEASQGGEGYANDLIGTAQGDLYVTGGFLGNWNFGTHSLVGDEEMFLIKLHYDSITSAEPIDAVTANFSANKIQLCTGEIINYTDSSTGNVDTWNWTFEGGTPATSTLQNPTVIYSQAGTYYAKLVVSNSTANDSVLISGCITVNALPVVNLGNDTMIVAGTTLILDAENSGSQYVWNNGCTSQTNTVNLDGTYSVIVTNPYGCIGTDEINIATTIMTSTKAIDNKTLLVVYPNPTTNILTISNQSKNVENLTLTVSDSNGKRIYTDSKKNFSGQYAKTIDLSKQSKGTYFIEMIADGKREVRKIVLD